MGIIPDESSIVPPESAGKAQTDQPGLEAATGAPKYDIEPVPESIIPPPDQSQFGTIPQQAVTALEGAAQGFLGPLAPMLETKVLGVPSEDIVSRENENPNTHGLAKYGTAAASLVTGTGMPGLVARGAGKLIPEAVTVLGKIGAAALSNGIQMGAIQGGDELSKAMLGQGDPQAPVSSVIMNIGGAGLLGAATGGVFSVLGQSALKGLGALEKAKLGERADNFMAGLGMAAKAHQAGIPREGVGEFLANELAAGGEFNINPYKDAIKFYYNGLKNISSSVAIGLGATAGETVDGPLGAIIGAKIADKHLTPVVEKVLNKPLIGMSKLVMPTFMKVLSTGQTSGLYEALDYAAKAAKGAKAANNAVENLFKAGITPTVNMLSERDENKIRDFVDEGGVTQQLQNQSSQSNQYAEGGEVQHGDDDPIANVYPDQNMLINAARGRVSNYLTSLKPQENLPKLSFDKEFRDHDKHKTYDTAIKIAANPLRVMDHVKDGTLKIEHLQHMNSMYPEVYQYLKNKLVARITQSQVKKETPPNFATRIAMSMFLGAPLSSSLTPQSIQAAQSTFIPMQPPPQASQNKPKKSTSTLGKDNKAYRTPEQAAEYDKASRD